MGCDVCGDVGGSRNPTFTCDCCKGKCCKSCANLTSSEVRVMELKETRVLKFICKKCEKFEHHTLLLKTIDDKNNIIVAKDEIITLLKEKISELEKSNIKQQFTYSQVTQNGQNGARNVNNLPSIIIKPKKQQNVERTEADIKKIIKPAELKIAIRNTKSTKNGSMLINCTNKADIEILKKEAENKLKEYDVQMTKMRLPRFRMVGYEGDLNEQQLSNSIREQNSIVGDDDIFRITYIRKTNKPNGTTSLVFGECSPALFRKIMHTNKLHVEWRRYTVIEDLSVPRCFKCQEFYHKHETCPNKQKCEFCAGEHHIKDCPKQNQKCINCKSTNDRFKLNYNIDHKASDVECPSYQYLLNIVKSKIDYGDGNGF